MEIKNAHPLITDSIERMLIDIKHKMPFYGQLNLMVNFTETDKIPTCGVNMTRKGMQFYYNGEFLDELCTTDGELTGDSKEEIELKKWERQKMVNFILLHQDFHLLFNHPQRTVGGRFDPYLANVAQDMIINSIIYEDISKDFATIPKYPDNEETRANGTANKNMTLFLPKEFIDDDNGSPIFEEVYTWLKEKKRRRDADPNASTGESYGSFGTAGGQSVDTFSVNHILDNINATHGEYMDSHMEDEIPDELRESYIRDAIDRLRSRGFSSGNVDDTLMKLRKKRKDYLREIKRSISNEIMGNKKTPSISRPNRRQIKGIKGHKKVKSRINVILDTSGSMQGMFEKVIEYVFQNDIEINICQVDSVVHSMETIRSMKELSKIDVRGLGGTMLQPAMDLITSSKEYSRYNTVILTDGMCDTLNMKYHRGKVLGVTCGVTIPHNSIPKKGYKEIIIEPTR